MSEDQRIQELQDACARLIAERDTYHAAFENERGKRQAAESEADAHHWAFDAEQRKRKEAESESANAKDEAKRLKNQLNQVKHIRAIATKAIRELSKIVGVKIPE